MADYFDHNILPNDSFALKDVKSPNKAAPSLPLPWPDPSYGWKSSTALPRGNRATAAPAASARTEAVAKMSPIVPIETLTPREVAVLKLITQGLTSREAGQLLEISPRTIEFHRANIMQKFSARNVADLMRMVLDQ